MTVRPSKFVHVAYRSRRFEEMLAWLRNAIAGSWYWTFAPNTVLYHASISSKRRVRYTTCTNLEGRTVIAVCLSGLAAQEADETVDDGR